MAKHSRADEIKKLQGQIEVLKREQREKSRIAAEKAEIKMLQQQLHPSKFRKLGNLLGKAEHGGVTVAKAFFKAGKEAHKAQQKYEKSRGR